VIGVEVSQTQFMTPPAAPAGKPKRS
jgi:hypothetical protein